MAYAPCELEAVPRPKQNCGKAADSIAGRSRTSHHLGPLEVLIGMDIRRGEGEVEPHPQKQQVESSPHLEGNVGGRLELSDVGWRG